MNNNENVCQVEKCNNKCKSYKYCFPCRELKNKSYELFIINNKKCINYESCEKYCKISYDKCYNCNNIKIIN